MPREHLRVAVLGGGISGLAAGYALSKKGIDFKIIEASEVAGGVIQTTQKSGYTFERGPNSMVATQPILSLIEELGLTDHLVRATAESNRRYILWKGVLHELAPSPKSIMQTKLLSATGKISILKDLFSRSKWKKGETVNGFFKRHFGSQIADRIASAMINGIYAGDANLLEMESVFPRLIEIEKEHSSIIRGMMKVSKAGGTKREIVSFKGGMKTLINRLAGKCGEELMVESVVEKVLKNENEPFQIEYRKNSISHWVSADCVINTLPANIFIELFTSDHPSWVNAKLPSRLKSVSYNPMLTFHLGFPSDTLVGKARGFGFLAPHGEEDEFIGVMFNSNTFKGQSSAGSELVTFFVRPKERIETKKDAHQMLHDLCLPKFSKWTGVSVAPTFIDYTYWPFAIPQKVIGHADLVEEMKKMEETIGGLYLSGNVRSGVSVGDCITYHMNLADSLEL